MIALRNFASLSATRSSSSTWSSRSSSRCGRALSSSSSSSVSPQDVRAFPQYAVFGDQCMLVFKLLPPHFRFNHGTQVLSLDPGRKGRMLVEWLPRNPDGTVTRDRDNHVRFGLAVEEIGLLLHQLPLQQAVSLVRKPAPSEAMYDSNTSTPHKVCTITPQDNQGGMVEWKVDYEIDGVGGQHISNNTAMQLPMAVTMQAGEVQVVLEIMRHSLPVLAGWTFAQNIAMQKAMNEAVRGGGYGGGGGGPPPRNDPYGF